MKSVSIISFCSSFPLLLLMMMSELLFCYYIHNAAATAGEVKSGSFLSFFLSFFSSRKCEERRARDDCNREEGGRKGELHSVGLLVVLMLLVPFATFPFSFFLLPLCTHQSENELNVDIPTATIQCSINSKTKNRTEEREKRGRHEKFT